MSDSNNDMSHAILNLNPEEKRAFAFLFNQADSDQLGVVTGERAVAFFERTKVDPPVLGEIWQLADTENRGFLSKPGFCMVLRLIGHYQSGKEPTSELAFKPGPIPKFEGLQIPGVGPANPQSPSQGSFPATALQPQTSGQGGIRIPPLDPQKVQQYSGLFDRSGAQNGMLDGQTAKAIFERAGLPNEVLGRIWNLSDREQRGALDQTEFIVAMHLLTSMKTKTMSALPNTLPQGFYEAAARRGAPPPGTRTSGGPVSRQFTGGPAGAPVRTQSPLARPPTFGTPPPTSAQTTGPPWLITAPEKAKYDQFFGNIDIQGRGIINGEQAVAFFSDSGLPEDTLASIWDLADINSEGQLNKDEFAVAMYLIRQQRTSSAAQLPAFLPPALIPPSLRKSNLQQQTQQTTAPAFDNANNTSNLPKSAAEDLFGLDEPSQGQVQQPPAPAQAQNTVASTTRDPFDSSVPGSPSSPARFQPQPQQPSSMFKPFMPTSAFGASLAQQNTGGSQTSSQGQARAVPQQQAPRHQPSAMDDLLGDDETNVAESSKLSNETTELANMSNQVGNLRSQMEQSQAKKSTTQSDLNKTSSQKRDLETRLQQFRTQYEQEVRAVKELEQQLTSSRESTKKLGQELALLEGSIQDLQTQHQTTAQGLQADQAENANLKQRITQLNAELSHLKPEIEKMKLDARQQKGMVSINKKQLATNEAERDRLQNEKAGLEREAAEAAERAKAALPASAQPTPSAREVTSPAGSTLSTNNPFFRKPSQDAASTLSRSASPMPAESSAATPSAFDQLFGPSFAQTGSNKSAAPATSFGGRGPASVAAGAAGIAGASAVAAGMADSMSSDGRPTPSATPPLSEVAKDSPAAVEPPPPPEDRQFTPGQLPVGGLHERSAQDYDEAGSTTVIPPASRAGGTDTPGNLGSPDTATTSAAITETVPGAFPGESDQPRTVTQETAESSTAGGSPAPAKTAAKDDFDSAFAGFGNGPSFGDSEKAKGVDDTYDPFNPSSSGPSASRSTEFPPIQSLDQDDEDSDSDAGAERGFGDDFSAAPAAKSLAPESAFSARSPSGSETAAARPNATSIESTASNLPTITAQTSPPSYEQSEHVADGTTGDRSGSNQFPKEFTGLLPSRVNPTSSPPPTFSPPPDSEPPPASEPANQQERDIAPAHQSGHASQFFSAQTPTSPDGTAANNEAFHDAYSRPASSGTDTPAEPAVTKEAEPTSATPPAAPHKNAFDDFDDFNDLSEAKEADKSGSDFDFGFGSHSREDSEFNAAFDSPAASMATGTPTTKSGAFGQSESSNGFGNFAPSASTGSAFGTSAGTATGNSSLQQTPQGAQHDWDAIFSGLDSSATDKIDTSLGGSAAAPTTNPWAPTNGTKGKAPSNGHNLGASSSSQAAKAQEIGRAITPGTEHDDPILKRLTSMGYSRGAALDALEKFDYDINKAVDHLSSK